MSRLPATNQKRIASALVFGLVFFVGDGLRGKGWGQAIGVGLGAALVYFVVLYGWLDKGHSG
jgi:hypothetical protein